MPFAIPPEISMMIGPKTTSTRTETMKTSSSGAKIIRTTAGMYFFSSGSILAASQAATMIGKIEYAYALPCGRAIGMPKNSPLKTVGPSVATT